MIPSKNKETGVRDNKGSNINTRFRWLLLVLGVFFTAIVLETNAQNEKHSFIIGTEQDYPPYSFHDENGNPTGYNIDLARAVARTTDLDVEFRIGPWNEIRHALENGEIDAIVGMFYSEERDELVDFSPPYTIVHHCIFVRNGNSSIKSEADLKDKDIIVMQGDIMHDYVLEAKLSKNPVVVKTLPDALRLLSSGEHDCALIAKLPGLYWQKELNLNNLTAVETVIHPSQYCFAVKNDNTVLLHQLGEGLALIGETGEHREVYEKWLATLDSDKPSLFIIFKYISIVGIPLLVLVILLTIWNRSLKRLVNQRTHKLAESEESLEHQNQILTAIRNINQLIVREKDPVRLLNEACHLLVESQGFNKVWIVRTRDGNPVGPILHAGFHDDFEQMAEWILAGNLPTCVQAALSSNDLQVFDDLANQCDDCKLISIYNGETGYSVRLEHAGQVFGCITLTCSKNIPHITNDHELMMEVAGDIAYALWAIETKKQREREQKLFGDVLDTIPDLVWLKDRNGVYLLCNQEFTKLVNSSKEKIIGGRDFDLFSREAAEFFREQDHIAMENKKTSINEELLKYAHFDYSVWVETSKTPMYDHQGELIGVLGIARDISSRKQALKESREEQAFLNVVVDQSPIPMWIGGPDGTVLRANQALYNALNLTADQIIGKYNLFQDENLKQPDIAEKLDLVINEKQTVQFDLTWKTDLVRKVDFSGGRDRYIDVSVYPLLNQEGEIAHIVVQWVDITNRKLEQNKLMLLNNALENSLNGFDIVDSDGVFTYVNKSYVKMWGYDSADEIIGTSPAGHCLDPEHAERMIQNLNETGRYEGEFTAKRKDGSTFEVLMYAQLNYDSNGMPIYQGTSIDITERKKAEEALITSEERFRAIYENAPVLINGFNEMGECVLWNKQCVKTFGWTMEEITAHVDALALFYPDPIEREKVLQTITNAPNGEFREWHPITKDGRELITMWANFRLPNGQVFSLGHDITERKKAEEKLRKSEELHREAQNIAHIAHWSYNPEVGIPWCSEEAYRIFGRDPGNGHIPYSEYANIIHPDDWEWFNATFQTSINNGTPYNIIMRVIHPDGNIRFINSICKPIKDDTGKVIEMRGTIQDITKLKHIEDSLKVSEQRAQLMADLVMESNQPVAVGYPDGRLARFNPAFCKLTGYSEKELLTIDWVKDLTPPEWTPIEQKALIELEKTSKPVRYEKEYIHKDGTRVPIELFAHIAYTSKGQPDYYYAFITDITERQKAEKEKEKLQSQLRQAMKMDAVGRLAGGVAHDFNNMLGVILGHSEILLEQLEPDQPSYSALTEIQKAGKRSADLTRQLLAFARKQTVAPKVIDLNATVSGMIKMLQHLIGEGIDLTWIPNNELWPVKIDPSQIDQILVNLCVNARDAIDGIGKVTIETGNTILDDIYCDNHQGFKPGEYVLLTVSDNGSGMDADTQANLFEPFFTTKEQGKGTGLGLATVYGIVKQNNGFINVYSETKHGTTFKIYLPRHLSKVPRVSDQKTNITPNRGHETILLVEDEDTILKIANIMLEKEGYSVIPASTPGQAIELASTYNGEIHLLITDVIMPEMNGRDLAKNILKHHPNMKRLFMSGYTANVIAHHGALDEGVNFIQKPFTKQGLNAKVRDVLDKE